MRYEETVYRPPSEAQSYILQATIGCSWNACTYCDMYRTKRFRVRELGEILDDIRMARETFGPRVKKVFVADGDALVMTLEQWEPILRACHEAFPGLRRVSTYATAMNILEKQPAELRRLRELGLSLLYIGPESGDDLTLKRIGKGADFDDHVRAARMVRETDMEQSLIFLLGIGGIERSHEHAVNSARLASEMDPRFLSLLTLTVIPGTPIDTLMARGHFQLPSIQGLLAELRGFVAACEPGDAIFRTNHASNYLPLSGRLPRDRERMVRALDAALAGDVPLRPEWTRGL
jgi:radical SAM superfamily enzyme YgiQ (UPF0313 family)